MYFSMSKYRKTFIGKPNKTIVDMLITYAVSWDNFSLSIMYLNILNNMYSNKFYNNKFIISFAQLLLCNIHPDCTKRKTIIESKTIFKNNCLLNQNMNDLTLLIKQFNYNQHTLINKFNSMTIDLPTKTK